MGPIWATRIWANPYGAHAEGSESPCRAEPPTYIVYFFNIILCGDFNKFYLKSSHRLKAINGSLIIIVNSYNLDLIVISL